jgi:hypothetical protein
MNHHHFLKPFIGQIIAALMGDGSEANFVSGGRHDRSILACAALLPLVGKPIFDLLE